MRRSLIPRVVTALLFACQVASVVLAGHVWAEGAASAGFGSTPLIVLVYAFVVFPVLGIVGLAWAIASAIKRWESVWVTVPLFAVSAAMLTVIPPLTTADRIGSVMLPRAEAKAHLAATRSRESFESTRAAHYDALLLHFSSPAAGRGSPGVLATVG